MAKERRQLWETVQDVRTVAEELTTVKFVSYSATGTHGGEPPEIAWRAAFGDWLKVK